MTCFAIQLYVSNLILIHKQETGYHVRSSLFIKHVQTTTVHVPTKVLYRTIKENETNNSLKYEFDIFIKYLAKAKIKTDQWEAN